MKTATEIFAGRPLFTIGRIEGAIACMDDADTAETPENTLDRIKAIIAEYEAAKLEVAKTTEGA